MTRNHELDDLQEEKILQAEEILRLLARLPAPAEMTGRIHARLRSALAEERTTRERSGFWAIWLPPRRLQFAGVVALAVLAIGSGWGVYRATYSQQGQAKHDATNAVVAPISGGASSVGLSTAGAVRTPPTLKPIKVPPAPRKKPGAGRLKPLPKVDSGQVDATQTAPPATPKQ